MAAMMVLASRRAGMGRFVERRGLLVFGWAATAVMAAASAAMQAKLDELLRALKGARDQFIGIEHLTDQQIELVRAALEKKAAELKGKTRTNGNGKKKGQADVKEEVDTVDRLLDRF
jgi:hypothetical protein